MNAASVSYVYHTVRWRRFCIGKLVLCLITSMNPINENVLDCMYEFDDYLVTYGKSIFLRLIHSGKFIVIHFRSLLCFGEFILPKQGEHY